MQGDALVFQSNIIVFEQSYEYSFQQMTAKNLDKGGKFILHLEESIHSTLFALWLSATKQTTSNDFLRNLIQCS